MVVVAVLAILVSIAILSYGRLVVRSKIRACQANLRTIDGAISSYYAEEREYPDNVGDLVSSGVLRSLPREPFTNQSYGIDLDHRAVCLNNDASVDGPHTY
jgi:general secretion pathway protein G